MVPPPAAKFERSYGFLYDLPKSATSTLWEIHIELADIRPPPASASSSEFRGSYSAEEVVVSKVTSPPQPGNAVQAPQQSNAIPPTAQDAPTKLGGELWADPDSKPRRRNELWLKLATCKGPTAYAESETSGFGPKARRTIRTKEPHVLGEEAAGHVVVRTAIFASLHNPDRSVESWNPETTDVARSGGPGVP